MSPAPVLVLEVFFFFKKCTISQLGLVAHACNPSTQEVEANLGCIARPFSQKQTEKNPYHPFVRTKIKGKGAQETLSLESLE
jgi:hypothetical protein